MATDETNIETIVRNGHRLLKDAELLYENCSYRTATSLAILAIEEFGKACILKWHEEGHLSREIWKDVRAGHKNKQKVLGALLAAEAAIEALKKFYDNPENQPDFDKTRADFSSNRDYVRYIWQKHIDGSNEALREVIARACYDKTKGYLPLVTAGGIDYIKQLGFYADVTEDFEIETPFGELDKDDAKDFLELAHKAADLPTKGEMLQRIMTAVYETTDNTDLRHRFQSFIKQRREASES